MRKILTIVMTVFLSTTAFAQEVQNVPAQEIQNAPTGSNKEIGVYITGSAPSEEARKALSREILTTLVSGGRYAYPSRLNDFEAALSHEARTNGRVSDTRLIEIARQNGLGYVYAADLTEVFGSYQITARIINARTGVLESAGKNYNEINNAFDLQGMSNKVAVSMFDVIDPKVQAAREMEEHIAKATACMESEDYDCAIAAYDKALAIDPNLLTALAGRADAHQRKGNFGNAVADYSRSIEIDPTDAGIYNSRAFAYKQMGNFDMAISDYSKSLELDPDDVGIYNSRASAYQELGNTEMAVADYQSALNIDPNNTVAQEALELIQLDKDGKREERPDRESAGTMVHFFAPKWMPPVSRYTQAGWAFNLEYGQISENRWWWSIDGGFGHQRDIYRYIDDYCDLSMIYGVTFNIGVIKELANNVHIAFGGSVGFWIGDWEDGNYYNYEGIRERREYAFGGPLVRLRWQFLEVTYRGLISYRENWFYWGWKDDFGYLSQLMIGFNFTSKPRYKRSLVPPSN